MVTDALTALRALAASGRRGIQVVPLDGSEPTVLDESQSILAGDALPDVVAAAFADVLAAGTPRLVEDEGRAWFVEAVLPRPRLVVLGAIAVADALVPMASAAGFAVDVVDPRPWLASPDRYPDARVVLCGEPSKVWTDLDVDGGTAVVSFLHEARLEDPVLRAALTGPAGYVGAMGSRRTTAAKRERLRRAGVDEQQLERLHAPIGLDFGAVTPEEIAIAVLAEIVAVRRGAG